MAWLAGLGAKLFELLLADFVAWVSKKYLEWKEKKKLDDELKKAGEIAKRTKNTSAAEDILRGGPKL